MLLVRDTANTASNVFFFIHTVFPDQLIKMNLWSIKKNLSGFPVTEHFNAAGHSADVEFGSAA